MVLLVTFSVALLAMVIPGSSWLSLIVLLVTFSLLRTVCVTPVVIPPLALPLMVLPMMLVSVGRLLPAMIVRPKPSFSLIVVFVRLSVPKDW